MLFAHEFRGATRGPVTAVAALEGHLLVAIGNKLLVHVWNGEKLEGCGGRRGLPRNASRALCSGCDSPQRYTTMKPRESLLCAGHLAGRLFL